VTCQDARERFSALIDGALAGEERARCESHLADCGECRGEIERLRATVTLLRSLEPPRAPAGFVDRVMAAARPTPWYRRVLQALFLPLALKLPLEAAAVVIVGVLAVSLLERSPGLQQAPRGETPRGDTPQVVRPAAPTREPDPAHEFALRQDAEPAPGRSAEPAQVSGQEPPRTRPRSPASPGAVKSVARGERVEPLALRAPAAPPTERRLAATPAPKPPGSLPAAAQERVLGQAKRGDAPRDEKALEDRGPSARRDPLADGGALGHARSLEKERGPLEGRNGPPTGGGQPGERTGALSVGPREPAPSSALAGPRPGLPSRTPAETFPSVEDRAPSAEARQAFAARRAAPAEEQRPAALEESRAHEEKIAGAEARDAVRAKGVESAERDVAGGGSRGQAAKPLAPSAAPDVSGTLAAGDRKDAARRVEALVARLGGVSRRSSRDPGTVEFRLSGGAYAEFVRELRALGTWTPEREPSELPAEVRVRLRLAP